MAEKTSEKAPKRRGRIKSPKKTAVILEAASTVFSREGFDRTSMDAVSAEAAVSKQTVYSHFGSKEKLFDAVIDAHCQHYEVQEQPIFDNRSCRAYLLDFASHLQSLLGKPEIVAIYRLCIGTRNQTRFSERFWSQGPAQSIDHLSQYFADQSRQGALHIKHPETVANQFVHALQGDGLSLALLGLSNAGAQSRQRKYRESLVDMLLSCYGTA